MAPREPNGGNGSPNGPMRILIVKLSSLGDIVHALPVARSLRATMPQARLAWVVEKKWLPLVERHPDLDEVFTVDSLALRKPPRPWEEFRDDVRRVRAFHPDITLDLQGTVKSATIVRLSGAAQRIGFAKPVLREWLAGFAYNQHVQATSVHTVDQYLDIAAAAVAGGGLQRIYEFPFPIPIEAQRTADDWIASNAIGEFAFLSPGGGWASKRWPSARYARLAELLEQDYGLAVVLNRGPGEEQMEQAYRRANAVRARLFSGDVCELAAMLKRARLVIGGDTGPLQLAAALDVPTVALFGPTDPARNGPYSRHSRVIRRTNLTTYKRGATYSPAMLAITPEEVAAACGELLEQTTR
ncbi:MAG: glycosyltransferase family 9 protein [Acidobacteria bacterium]|nr:MAG: glycosyltransferase family 9 protein [Acidobacteriota bacterium]